MACQGNETVTEGAFLETLEGTKPQAPATGTASLPFRAQNGKEKFGTEVINFRTEVNFEWACRINALRRNS